MKTTNPSPQAVAISAQTSTPVQSPRADRLTALYLGCMTNDLSGSTKPIWLPIYRLSWDDEGYFYYSYTRGFKDNYEQLRNRIINPDCGFNQLWKTKHLDTRFSTRYPRRASSMKKYDWLGIGNLKGDYLAYLARSGGTRVRDSYDIFPEVQAGADGFHSFHFYVTNTRNRTEGEDNLVSLESVLTLRSIDSKSYIFHGNTKVGECPEYIHYLLDCDVYRQHQIGIEQINQQSAARGQVIVINLKIKFSSSPWQQSSMKPLNSMPV